jgi:dTMP kinase
VLIDVPLEVAATRRGADLDRFEAEDDGFHRRVVEGFRELAAAEPDRWVVVDGTPSIADVAQAVREVVAERLDLTL